MPPLTAETDFFALTEQMGGAIFQLYRAAPRASEEPAEPLPVLFQLRRGYAESPAWFLVQAAEFRPEPLTVERLRVRDVYGAPSLVRALLDLMASEPWLERRGDAYHLLPAGQEQLALVERSRTHMAEVVTPLLALDADRLAGLLRRILDASLASGDPPGTWCLAHSRRRAPADNAPAVRQLLQYSADFNAFRDDCHMAAYLPHHIVGHTWEAFSFVWRGDAVTADALFEQLHYRGYSREDYAAALDELAVREWIVFDQDVAQVTEQGRDVREEAERRTNAYYYAPWSCLSESEIREVRDLLTALIDQGEAAVG